MASTNPTDTTPVSQDPAHQDGIDHIKSKLDERSVDSSAPTTATDTPSTTQGGIIDTVKSYLGYSSTGATTGTDTTDGSSTTGTNNISSTLSSAGSSAANTVSSGLTSAAAMAGLTPADSSSTTNPNTSSSSATSTVPETDRDNTRERTHGAGMKDGVDPTTGAESKPSTSDEADAPAPKDPAQDTKPKAASGASGNLENKDAIPTAGGQRLGEAHWGESKIVPDNPKPNEDAAGQPTDEVKANTAKNTGGSSVTDPSAMDKLKDKLPFHKKE